MKELQPIVSGMARKQLVVIGDLLLDEFVFGEIARTSREAPVLILSYRERDWRPGGAANTVAGAAALGCRVSAVGAIGNDAWGRALLSSWPDSVDSGSVIVSDQLSTTCKSRVLAGSFHSFRQQVVRIDYEHPHSLSQEVESEMIASIERQLPTAGALIVSDYSLGTITEAVARQALRMAREARLPLIVDSRFRPELFRGATCMTPNISEVEAAVGKTLRESSQSLHEVGRQLLREWDLECLVITRGKLGMLVFESERTTEIEAFGSDEVADVTGAGDTVTATFAAALAAGADFSQAAQLANIAAGIVVTKKGTATVSSDEILDAIRGMG